MKFGVHVMGLHYGMFDIIMLINLSANKVTISILYLSYFMPIKVYNNHGEVIEMQYLSVREIAKQWKISERSIRNYCALGRIPNAFITGKTWNIPADAEKPMRKPKAKHEPSTLLGYLKREQKSKLSGGIYHKLQIEFTYNSNHIEGSQLSYEQTRYIFETNTIGASQDVVWVDDVLETINHFKCIDMVIEAAHLQLNEKFITSLHHTLKSSTSDSRNEWFALGEYKKLPNEVGGLETTKPSHVASEMFTLLRKYNGIEKKTITDLIDFHVRFERIHPFQDGNGRVGRLILLKECLKNNIVPFIITEELKLYYYKGLKHWDKENGYLMDTCLNAQDHFKKYLDYFQLPYKND